MKTGAVIYCRVSTEDQVDNNSLPVQQRDCREKAERLGCEVLDAFVEEGVSGTKQDRPAMARMLAYCAEHKDRVRYVIVKDIDRFSRDVLVYHVLRAQFRSLGISLYSVNQPNIADGTAESRLLEAMFSGFSQYEHDKILQRTSDGTKEAITKGGWITYAPYGYRTHRTADNVPTLAIIPDEANGVRTAYELYAGGMGLFDVTRRIAELGFRSRRGGRHIFQTVYNILHNPVYIGRIQSRYFPDRLITGRHPPIIDMRLWDRVQARLSKKESGVPRSRCNPTFPLAGTVRCPACGWTMTGSFSRSRTGKRYGYYHCRRNGCRSRNLPKATTEENFVVLLTRVGPTGVWVDDYEREVVTEWQRQQRELVAAGRQHDKRLTELEAKRSRIEDAYFEGKVDEAAYRRNLRRVEEDIADIGATAKKPSVSEERLRVLLAYSRRFFTELSNSWEDGSIERKKRIQRLVFPEGVRCDADGLYRTVTLPPTLAIFRDTKDDRSSLVALTGTSWNFREDVRAILTNAADRLVVRHLSWTEEQKREWIKEIARLAIDTFLRSNHFSDISR